MKRRGQANKQLFYWGRKFRRNVLNCKTKQGNFRVSRKHRGIPEIIRQFSMTSSIGCLTD